MMAVTLKDYATFDDFLNDAIARRDNPQRKGAPILVKLADYGFVSPMKVAGGGIVMMPQIKVVATAFDRATGELLRWQQSEKASSTITIGSAPGAHGDVRIRAKKDTLKQWLELEGFSVTDGEWKPEEIESLLRTQLRKVP
jgi:hypothetical protein